MRKNQDKNPKKAPNSGLITLLKPYSRQISILIILALLSNGINLIIPKIIQHAIDAYSDHSLFFSTTIRNFCLATLGIFLFAYLQRVFEIFTAERVARDLRSKVSKKISKQSYAFVEKITAGKLLTNLTSDVDAVKSFISQAIVAIFSSAVIIVGASVLLLTINWRLGFIVLTIIPIIGFSFYLVFSKVKFLFKKSQGVIDKLNRVINESILGAALVRVLNAQIPEYEKFITTNKEALNIGISILRLFAILIPIVSFVANLALLTVLALGGHFVIAGSMTLGEFAAFNSYISLLIFPIIMIGFMSNVIARASASFQRIQEVIQKEDQKKGGRLQKTLKGDIEIRNISLAYQAKPVLKDISFLIKAQSRTAIIGPTAAGKTQLFYLLTGLTKPDSGEIYFDGIPFSDYDPNTFYSQVGLVFQDSIIFNVSLKENIAFNQVVSEDAMKKAIETAELSRFIDQLPHKLETLITERGTILSGGQKQRVMLARALALEPKILLLDEFTARVDIHTERKILANVKNNYPDITLLSITQTIDNIKDYDQIILLMEGEIPAKGTHQELLNNSPAYNQIYQSQRSTNNYAV